MVSWSSSNVGLLNRKFFSLILKVETETTTEKCKMLEINFLQILKKNSLIPPGFFLMILELFNWTRPVRGSIFPESHHTWSMSVSPKSLSQRCHQWVYRISASVRLDSVHLRGQIVSFTPRCERKSPSSATWCFPPCLHPSSNGTWSPADDSFPQLNWKLKHWGNIQLLNRKQQFCLRAVFPLINWCVYRVMVQKFWTLTVREPNIYLDEWSDEWVLLILLAIAMLLWGIATLKLPIWTIKLPILMLKLPI